MSGIGEGSFQIQPFAAARAAISGADELPDLPFVIVPGLGFKVAGGAVLVV